MYEHLASDNPTLTSFWIIKSCGQAKDTRIECTCVCDNLLRNISLNETSKPASTLRTIFIFQKKGWPACLIILHVVKSKWAWWIGRGTFFTSVFNCYYLQQKKLAKKLFFLEKWAKKFNAPNIILLILYTIIFFLIISIKIK